VLLVAPGPVGAATEAERGAIRRLLASGETMQALERADRALAGDPHDVTAAFLRGVALMDLGRDAEALAHFERMSQEHPQLPDPLNNMALLQARAGRLDAAREALETALRNDPGHRTARANLGLVHLMLAARSWEPLAASGPLDPTLAGRLQAVRALLAEASAEEAAGVRR
jgi:Flp pilus assembly protein TadD